jgi:hypothetical protein
VGGLGFAVVGCESFLVSFMRGGIEVVLNFKGLWRD